VEGNGNVTGKKLKKRKKNEKKRKKNEYLINVMIARLLFPIV
jgi:hypothetical protein